MAQLKHKTNPSAGFMSEQEMESLFSKQFRKGRPTILGENKIGFGHWYVEDHNLDKKWGTNDILYAHHEGVQGGPLSCDYATDEWYRWFLTTPRSHHPMVNPRTYGDTDAYLLNLGDTSLYFTTAAPFQNPPDVRRLVMTKKAALLVPVYNVLVSPQLFPSVGASNHQQKCEQLVTDDLFGIREDKIQATFDGKPIYGCCVMRTRTPVRIGNIPKDNVIGIPEHRLVENDSIVEAYHGGFWLLLRENKLTQGDHLLTFTSASKNYEMNAQILITSLV
jgi:hypothetical protein